MNDRIDWTSTSSVFLHSDNADNEAESNAQWRELHAVLASPVFAKAPRMCGLLSFLMTRKLAGMAGTINEHAIGVAVFRRDPRDFDTTIDPVVRVQMGRLRERLAQYYATASVAGTLRIEIPAGSYVPVVSTTRAMPRPAVRLAPLRTLTPDSGAAMFVSGLEEELAQQLFVRFGNPCERAPGYGVHVSVRVEQLHARASIRLLDAGDDRLLWLHQRDCRGSLGIALQEKLALAICEDLSGFMARRPQAAGVASPGVAQMAFAREQEAVPSSA